MNTVVPAVSRARRRSGNSSAEASPRRNRKRPRLPTSRARDTTSQRAPSCWNARGRSPSRPTCGRRPPSRTRTGSGPPRAAGPGPSPGRRRPRRSPPAPPCGAAGPGSGRRSCRSRRSRQPRSRRTRSERPSDPGTPDRTPAPPWPDCRSATGPAHPPGSPSPSGTASPERPPPHGAPPDGSAPRSARTPLRDQPTTHRRGDPPRSDGSAPPTIHQTRATRYRQTWHCDDMSTRLSHSRRCAGRKVGGTPKWSSPSSTEAGAHTETNAVTGGSRCGRLTM